MSGAYVTFVRCSSAALAHNFTLFHKTGERASGEADLAMSSGKTVERAALADLLVHGDGAGGAPAGVTTRRSVITTGLIFVRATVADILRDHDLGDSFLWPVDAVTTRREPITGEQWFGLWVESWKECLLVDKTTALGPAYAAANGNFGRSLRQPSIEAGTGDVVLDPGKLGGADIWFDAALRYGSGCALFVSARLRAALAEAGFAEEFQFFPCATEWSADDR